MAVLTRLERVKLLTRESDEALLEELIEEAEMFVLAYTNRQAVIPELEKCVIDYAVITYNRLGTEGERSRSEGGENYTFDSIPTTLSAMMKRYRKARCGGNDENETE